MCLSDSPQAVISQGIVSVSPLALAKLGRSAIHDVTETKQGGTSHRNGAVW